MWFAINGYYLLLGVRKGWKMILIHIIALFSLNMGPYYGPISDNSMILMQTYLVLGLRLGPSVHESVHAHWLRPWA